MSTVQEGRRSEHEALGVSCGSSLTNQPVLTGGNEVSVNSRTYWVSSGQYLLSLPDPRYRLGVHSMENLKKSWRVTLEILI